MEVSEPSQESLQTVAVSTSPGVSWSERHSKTLGFGGGPARNDAASAWEEPVQPGAAVASVAAAANAAGSAMPTELGGVSIGAPGRSGAGTGASIRGGPCSAAADSARAVGAGRRSSAKRTVAVC